MTLFISFAEVFEYRLEIASEGISQEEEIKERKVQYEVISIK